MTEITNREELRGRVSELEGVLKPFAEAADNALDERIDRDVQDIWESAAALSLTVGDLRRARQALDRLDSKGQ